MSGATKFMFWLYKEKDILSEADQNFPESIADTTFNLLPGTLQRYSPTREEPSTRHEPKLRPFRKVVEESC